MRASVVRKLDQDQRRFFASKAVKGGYSKIEAFDGVSIEDLNGRTGVGSRRSRETDR